MPESRIRTVTASPDKKLIAIAPELKRLYEATTTKMAEDSLSNLYVAITRAARKIEMIVPWADPDKKPGVPTAASFIRAALPSDELQERDEEGIIWRHPEEILDGAWAKGIEEAQEEEPPEEVLPLDLAPSTRPRSLPRRSPSAEEGGGTVHVRSLLGEKGGAKFGTLVHEWLEELTWIEEFELDENCPARADVDLRDKTRTFLRGALEQDEIRAALSREYCGAPRDSTRDVRNEYAFSTVLTGEAGREELWTGSIDRLVLGLRGDEVVWAEILDYKTDRIDSPEELDERAEHYRPQLESYRRVVAAQTGLALESIGARLLFLGPGRVVEV